MNDKKIKQKQKQVLIIQKINVTIGNYPKKMYKMDKLNMSSKYDSMCAIINQLTSQNPSGCYFVFRLIRHDCNAIANMSI